MISKLKISLLAAMAALCSPVAILAQAPESAVPVLQPFVERHAVAGAVALVADKDKVLSVAAVGYADVGAKKPMAEDTMFWIASQTKPMTAVAVMMLVDEGKMALDDPVEKYLPEFRGQKMIAEKSDAEIVLRAPARPITVRDTLNHMSGLPFASAVETPTLDGLPLAAAVKSYAMMPLQWEPGTRYQYSNAGINTAARVLEVVSKMPYEEFMQKRLFDPLGMKDTTFWPSPEQAARVAKSYRPNAAKTDLEEIRISQLIYPLEDRARRFPMPAGGLFSTARDTARFCQMLLGGGQLEGRRYLSDRAMRELSMRQTPAAVKESYGLGFSVSGDAFGHGGAQATNMEVRPAQGIAVVWMVQHSGFAADGGKAQGEFRSWAVAKFARPQPQRLPRSTPESQGVSSAIIREFIETADEKVDTMHSFMLVRHGYVVAEGWWKPEAAEKPHVLHSLSKSFTSTAVGMAVAEGKLSVDDPVLKFFPDEAPAQPSDKLKAMRVRDLLTMSTGHNTEPKFTADEPWVKSFLAHEVPHKPGAHFMYNSPATYVCSAIVGKVTGQTVLDYLKPRLFEPLGIESPEWGRSPEGHTVGGWGLHVRTEDIAKFGQLYLRKGKWNGKQLVPASWVEMATAKQVSNGSDPGKDWDQGYGFQFWRCRHGAYRGDGAFGQFCLVLPGQDAVIAITADAGNMQAELNIVWEKLLPAFHGAPLQENAGELSKLQEKLGNLAVREGHKANVIRPPGSR